MTLYYARNKVISHDQLNFTENIVGITVNHATGIAEDIAEITVRTGYLYQENQKLLLRMVRIVLKYLDCQIESIKNYLIEEYNREKPDLKHIACENVPMSNKW